MSNLSRDIKISTTATNVSVLNNALSKIRQKWDDSSREALLNSKKYEVKNLEEMFLDLRKNV